MLTDKQLAVTMPNCSSAKRGLYLPFIQQAMGEFEINTYLRASAFLAQLAHESAELRYMEEIASGAAYEGRANLGNTHPGDGKRYKGRGPIQLTGRANYTKYGKLLGLDLVNNPTIAATKEIGFRIASLYWKLNGLNELADKGSQTVTIKVQGKSKQVSAFDAITYKINGGFNGKDDRQAYYERAKHALKGGDFGSIAVEDEITELEPIVTEEASPTVTSETGKPTESTVAAPAASEESSSQKIQHVAQSLGSKIMAGGLTGGGGLGAILLAITGALKNPYVIVGIVIVILVGAYLWNESKKRQTATQNKLIDAAASKEKNTVAIVPPPAATG